jgi:glycerophosphoryl diester phosphodiesterase
VRPVLLLAAFLALAAPAAAAKPLVFAHRGGALERGAPAYPENTLPAFRAAARRGWILEFDVHVTADGAPIVIHDDTLDRVVGADCPFRNRAIGTLQLAEVRQCPVMFDGRPGEALPSAPAARPQPVPTLAEVLALAGRTRSTISPEIKNTPPIDGAGPGDFDPTPALATNVATALRDSGFPQSRMIVQSFWPPDLAVAKGLLPDAQMLFLTLAQLNATGPVYAQANGYDWVGPQFDPGGLGGVVAEAHQLGLKVAPFTLNSTTEFELASSLDVDGMFTDDPALLAGAPRLGVVGRARTSGRCRTTLRVSRLVARGRWCGRGRLRVALARRTLLRTRSGRRWHRALPRSLPPGRYRLSAVVRRRGRTIGRAGLRLVSR